MKIYLAGGMNSNWRSKVMEGSNGHTYIDPNNNGTDDPRLYTTWDLYAVRISDCVFAYMEKDNPSGFGMTYEMGYAKGLGKLVIFVNEKSDNKYLKILEFGADATFYFLEEGIDFLDKLKGLEW